MNVEIIALKHFFSLGINIEKNVNVHYFLDKVVYILLPLRTFI